MEETASVQCWGCFRELIVPMYQKIPVPTVKCGWCGALVEDVELIPTVNGNTTTATHTFSCTSSSTSASKTAPPPLHPVHRPLGQQMLGCAMIALVFTLVTVVGVGGVFVVLPESFYDSSRLYKSENEGIAISSTTTAFILFPLQIIGASLYFIILYNYISILVHHPGPVAAKQPSTMSGEIYMLNDWRWCKPCNHAKPPTAHHCRRCGFCVEGMDHHCLFTANRCVGSGNMSPFLKFLYFLLAGCIMASLAGAVMAWKQQHAIFHHSFDTWYRPAQFGLPLHAATFAWRWVLFAPLKLSVWASTFMFAVSSGIGVALLLHRQLLLKARGSTVLGELQRRRRELHASETGVPAAVDMKVKGM